ncbi:unnamed protein product [Caenorhabditis angaria]|uniref:C2H2-type domain-containing protein n=1 Tax=Caenorhabditis angaria TaxID=860376 RepID=A0A9P1IBX5_9PELO|nr:unnamed protein product [Caenorhabditis angaria]
MANVIGGGPRKPPRIIARKNPVKKELKPNLNTQRNYELDKLRSAGFEVQSGMLTVNPNAIFIPKELPGIANEVESYPCRYCVERVFLTSSGLEKHAKEHHPNEIDVVMSEILMISAEWKKREFEKIRSKERQTIDRMRHEARATEMIRASMNAENPIENDSHADSYEACNICNVLINAAHPTAMESHQRAHKKNDELRMQLLEQYGVEIVQRLTCDSCSLVFMDENKLRGHIQSHHMRKKRYICKFCGNISQSLMELNLHKTDVHNVVLNSRAYVNDQWNAIPDYIKSRRQIRKRKWEAPQDDKVMGKITKGDVPCRIQCPDCPLKLNRPVFLIKHMQRVHNKTVFGCFVETGGLPTFRIDVEEDAIYWTCCNIKYMDRQEFIRHRRCHIPGSPAAEIDEEIVEGTSSQGVEVDGENFEGELVQGPDGTMQVIIPEGMEINGDVYVMFDNDYDGNGETSNGGEKEHAKTGKVRIVHAHQRNPREEVSEEHVEGIIDQGEDEDGREVITLTQEQFDQLQMEMGDEWNNMEIVLVNSDGQIIEDENRKSNEPEINGQPLFD